MKNSEPPLENAVNIVNINLSDLGYAHANVVYNDEELIILNSYHHIPKLLNCKLDFNIILACIKGKLQFEINNNLVTLNSGQELVCHSHVLISNFMSSPDIECRLICLSDRVLKNILQTQISIWNKAMYPNHYYILNIIQEHQPLIETLLPALHKANSTLEKELLISILRTGFLLICNRFSTHKPFDSTNYNSSRMNTLFHQFLNNIAQRQQKKARVAVYANELCITPKYLTTICRKMSGKSALTWISEYVTEDIIYYLKNTDLSAKEIAHRLGFENASHFGKFTKTHLGMSPQEYRKSIVGKKL